MQPFQGIMRSLFEGSFSPFEVARIPFERLCIIQYVVSAKRKKFHYDYIIAPLAEN